MKTTTKNIRLILRPEIDERIRHYTALASGEFSALGLLEECPEGFLVTDLFLLEQISTSGSTELNPISVGNLLTELEDSGRDPLALRFWVHSHGDSDVFWSGTDHRTIDDFLFAAYGTGVELRAHPRHYSNDPLSGIVICAVDTMDTRLLLWREVKKLKPDLYIDARMGAEVGKIHLVHPADPASCRRYEEDLYPSSEALQAPCTAKATVYCAAGLSSFIGGAVTGYANGRKIEGMVVDFRNDLMLSG